MKITKLTTFIVPPRWCFVKVETDEGITGWGEPVVEGRAHTVAAAVDELADYLIGKDASLIEDHWTVMYRAGFYRGGANGRATKISYNRPFNTRSGSENHDFFFANEYPMVRFLEKNGYDVQAPLKLGLSSTG